MNRQHEILPWRAWEQAAAIGARRTEGSGRLHRAPDRFEAIRGENLTACVRGARLAAAPLQMWQVGLPPVAAPAALLEREALGDRAEPGLRPVPVIGPVDDVDREAVAVPAVEVGRRVGHGP